MLSRHCQCWCHHRHGRLHNFVSLAHDYASCKGFNQKTNKITVTVVTSLNETTKNERCGELTFQKKHTFLPPGDSAAHLIDSARLARVEENENIFLKSRWSHISKRCCCVSWCQTMMVRLVDQWTIESQEIWRVENRSHGDNDRNPVEKLIGRNRWNHPRLEALTDGCPLCQGETNHKTLLHYCWCWSSKSSAMINQVIIWWENLCT